jgi:hypothetical protein
MLLFADIVSGGNDCVGCVRKLLPIPTGIRDGQILLDGDRELSCGIAS